jgi:hypothetical protein
VGNRPEALSAFSRFVCHPPSGCWVTQIFGFLAEFFLAIFHTPEILYFQQERLTYINVKAFLEGLDYSEF